MTNTAQFSSPHSCLRVWSLLPAEHGTCDTDRPPAPLQPEQSAPAACEPAEVSALRHQVTDLQQQLSALRLSAGGDGQPEVTAASGPQTDPAAAPGAAEALERAAAAELEVAGLRRRLAELEQPAAAASGAAELPQLRHKVERQEAELRQLRGAGAELEELRREQEDLLVLLTDQEARQEEYKRQLRQLGVQVSCVRPMAAVTNPSPPKQHTLMLLKAFTSRLHVG